MNLDPTKNVMGAAEGPELKEFKTQAKATLEGMLTLLKEAQPKPPMVENSDPAAAGREVAAGLQIDTERKDPNSLDEEVVAGIRQKFTALRVKMNSILKSEKAKAGAIPPGEIDKMFTAMWDVERQFRDIGIDV